MKKPLNKPKVSPVKAFIFTTVFLSFFVILFFSVELVLNLNQLGVNTAPFVKLPAKPDVYVSNPEFSLAKYHQKTIKSNLSVINDMFPVEKSTVRGIVLGESTAKGTPYATNQVFPKMTEVAINQVTGKKSVEILNLAGAAMSSFYLRDIVQKLPEYKPDFVVIYAGHNEYYGTITSVNTPSFLNQLYLSLKEWRTFQLLFNLMAPQSAAEKDQTLMASQFNKVFYPLDQNRDTLVDKTFIENLDYTVKFLTDRNIQVFVFKPVSNLTGMPPFAGEGSEAIKPKLEELYGRLISGNKEVDLGPEIDELYQKNSSNAEINFIKALYSVSKKSPDLELFKRAKDLDLVPFRARSGLLSQLSEWANRQEKINSKFHYLDTEKYFINEFGPGAFGKNIFIDQLHFNIPGHILVSKFLGQAIMENVLNQKNDTLKAYYKNVGPLMKEIHFTEMDDFNAAYLIKKLYDTAPYSNMVLPAPVDLMAIVDQPNIFLANVDLAKSLAENGPVFHKVLLPLLVETKDYSSIDYYLRSAIWKSPGFYLGHLEYGNFLAGLPNAWSEAELYWKQALVLSNKKSEVVEELRINFERAGKLESFERFLSTPF